MGFFRDLVAVREMDLRVNTVHGRLKRLPARK